METLGYLAGKQELWAELIGFLSVVCAWPQILRRAGEFGADLSEVGSISGDAAGV